MKKETKAQAIARLLSEEGFNAIPRNDTKVVVWLSNRSVSATEVQAALPFAVRCTAATSAEGATCQIVSR